MKRLDEIAKVYEVLIRLFHLENQPSPSNGDIVLDEEEFLDISACIASGDSPPAPQRLVKYDVEEECGAALLESLGNYQVSGTILAAAWRGSSWETADLGLLVATNGVWRVHPHEVGGSKRVRFTPHSAEDAQEKIKRLLSRMLPIRL